MMRLQIVPMSLKEANAYVEKHHRHHRPARGCKFCIGVALDDGIVGALITGRPVSRHLDNGWTLEVTRCCTDGTKNACSALYGAAWRAAKAMGYNKLITYTLPEEGGGSLRGAGWICLGEAGGGSWSRMARPRDDSHPLQKKFKWEVSADE